MPLVEELSTTKLEVNSPVDDSSRTVLPYRLQPAVVQLLLLLSGKPTLSTPEEDVRTPNTAEELMFAEVVFVALVTSLTCVLDLAISQTLVSDELCVPMSRSASSYPGTGLFNAQVMLVNSLPSTKESGATT